MPDAVIVLDALHRVVDINPAAQRLLHRSAAEMIGQTATQVFAAWPHLLAHYHQVGTLQTETVVVEGPQPGWYDLRLVPLADCYGQFNGRLLVLRDITARNTSRRSRQSGEKHLSRQYEPRIAYPAQCHYWL
jgi:PAS domain S-box-containing protein